MDAFHAATRKDRHRAGDINLQKKADAAMLETADAP